MRRASHSREAGVVSLMTSFAMAGTAAGLETMGTKTRTVSTTQLFPKPVFAGPCADPSWNHITAHVTAGWPRLGEPLARYRGQYCYIDALLPCHREPTPILRLRYQGSAGDWAIGIYKASTGQYSENELPGAFGGATGTPEQGIEETFILYAGPRTAN